MLHPLEGRWQAIRIIHFQLWVDWYIGNVVFKVAEIFVYILHIYVLSECLFHVVPTNRFEQTLYHTNYIVSRSASARHKPYIRLMHLPHSDHV